MQAAAVDEKVPVLVPPLSTYPLFAADHWRAQTHHFVNSFLLLKGRDPTLRGVNDFYCSAICLTPEKLLNSLQFYISRA